MMRREVRLIWFLLRSLDTIVKAHAQKEVDELDAGGFY